VGERRANVAVQRVSPFAWRRVPGVLGEGAERERVAPREHGCRLRARPAELASVPESAEVVSRLSTLADPRALFPIGPQEAAIFGPATGALSDFSGDLVDFFRVGANYVQQFRQPVEAGAGNFFVVVIELKRHGTILPRYYVAFFDSSASSRASRSATFQSRFVTAASSVPKLGLKKFCPSLDRMTSQKPPGRQLRDPAFHCASSFRGDV
jgi:hypothetical protein